MKYALNVLAVIGVLGCAILLGRQMKRYGAEEGSATAIPMGPQQVEYNGPSSDSGRVSFGLMLETPDGEMLPLEEYRRRFPESFAPQPAEQVAAPESASESNPKK